MADGDQMNMRQGGPSRRPRGRHNGGSNGGGHSNHGGGVSQNRPDNRPRSASALRHQTFDSNGPDVRVRGNAMQVYEKYQSLARDAQSAGDRVLAENYLQHAEHFFRVTEAINEAMAAEQRIRGPQPQPFGAQPEVPANYYTPDGQLAAGQQPQPALQADGPQPMLQPQMQTQPQPVPAEPAQAEVTRRTPPPQPAFFTQEEVEDHAGVSQPRTAAER